MKSHCFLLVLLLPLMWETSCSDQTLDPGGRNVCNRPKRRPYTYDALRPREWQMKTDDLTEYRCCDGWRQQGDSCPEAVCNTPCVHGYCASPSYCLCDEHWTGPTCEEKICPVLSQGGRCVFECDCPSGRCDHSDGSCACPLGFTGLNCNDPCASGYHGPNCRIQCQCDNNITCASDTGLCMKPQNISTVPDASQLELHLVRMTVLTGCGVAAVVAVISATAYAVRKRQRRRVFNVRKRTMSMTPITRRTTICREETPIKSTPSMGGRRTKHTGCSVMFPRNYASASYIGMGDLLADGEEVAPGTSSRPMSCLSTSTTFSMVESISESRDTIYEVHESDVLGALRNQETTIINPQYTNSNMFSSEKVKRQNQRLSSIRGGMCGGYESDTDDEEYNYPYADLAMMRLPAAAEMVGENRALRPCSSNTEYVVVLKQDQNAASFTPAQIELGLRRDRPSGMSFSEVAASSSPPSSDSKTMQCLRDDSRYTKMDHYQVPRSPPIKRFTETSCNQSFVRGYVTSVRHPSSLKRGSDHRRTRRMKTEILKCPPPPPYIPPEAEMTPPVYINDRITSGAARQSVPCPRKAPPIPKPRTRQVAGMCPAQMQDAEGLDSEVQGTERFI